MKEFRKNLHRDLIRPFADYGAVPTDSWTKLTWIR